MVDCWDMFWMIIPYTSAPGEGIPCTMYATSPLQDRLHTTLWSLSNDYRFLAVSQTHRYFKSLCMYCNDGVATPCLITGDHVSLRWTQVEQSHNIETVGLSRSVACFTEPGIHQGLFWAPSLTVVRVCVWIRFWIIFCQNTTWVF